MSGALLFLVLVLCLGPLGAPYAALLFPRAAGGAGIAFARPLALLLVGYPTWLLASLKLVPFGTKSIVCSFAAVALGACGLAARHRRRGGRAEQRSVSLWLTGEAIFVVAFGGWLLIRSFSPAVWGTEKPMDMAIINAIGRSTSFPPVDPWLADAHINYYYFGHYLVAVLIRITGVDPAVGFNLAIALFAALAATSVFGVAALLQRGADGLGGRRLHSARAVGITAAALATTIGTLAGLTQFVHHLDRLGTYDWWSPSRVIPGTANEFPVFSFLLADLHAHVMATPFGLTVVAYAAQLVIHGPPTVASRPVRAAAELAIAGLMLGSLYAIDGLDFPTAAALLVGAGLLRSLHARDHFVALLWSIAIAGVSIIVFVPFWSRFSPPTNGIGLVHGHLPFLRFAGDELLIYATSLWVALGFLVSRYRVARRPAYWLGSLALFVLVLLDGRHLAGLAVLLGLAAVAIFAALGSRPLAPAQRFAWLLLAFSFALLASGELLYIRDAFDGTISYRFNTVFKTGYQAWYLLAIVAALGLSWSASWFGRRTHAAFLGGSAVLVACGLVYPILAGYSRSGGFRSGPTLDGMAWLTREAPGDAAAIGWLRHNVAGAPTVLEIAGADFDPSGGGRVSTYTGLPSVVQWPGHELQWGHQPGDRAQRVAEIYSTGNLQLARRLLAGYGVRYVFVGTLERRAFPSRGLLKFRRLGMVAFRSGTTVVYRLGSEPAAAHSVAFRNKETGLFKLAWH
jgi:YYY domain-containing protein